MEPTLKYAFSGSAVIKSNPSLVTSNETFSIYPTLKLNPSLSKKSNPSDVWKNVSSDAINSTLNWIYWYWGYEYIKYLGNKRLKEINLEPLFDGYNQNPALWVDGLSDANSVKTDFFEARSTAYAKVTSLIDDL